MIVSHSLGFFSRASCLLVCVISTESHCGQNFEELRERPCLNDLGRTRSVAVSAIFHCQYSSSSPSPSPRRRRRCRNEVGRRSQTAFTHCGAIIESQMVFCQLKEEATDRQGDTRQSGWQEGEGGSFSGLVPPLSLSSLRRCRVTGKFVSVALQRRRRRRRKKGFEALSLSLYAAKRSTE